MFWSRVTFDPVILQPKYDARIWLWVLHSVYLFLCWRQLKDELNFILSITLLYLLQQLSFGSDPPQLLHFE